MDAETRRTMDNIARVLQDHGYDFENIVSATVYLNDIEDDHEMNASYFDGTFPAQACVGGAQILFGFRGEISVIVWKDQSGEDGGQ